MQVYIAVIQREGARYRKSPTLTTRSPPGGGLFLTIYAEKHWSGI